MKNQYKYANDTLNSKAQSTEYARNKAQQLLQRASKITVDTNNKLKELRGMLLKLIIHDNRNILQSNVFHSLTLLHADMVSITTSNDDELTEMEGKILKLNGEIDVYIQRIRDHADRYRTCTS